VTDPIPMRLEPVEIQHVELRRVRRGYLGEDVDRLLEVVTASYEEVWFERDALLDHVQQLQAEVERARERERLVGDVVRAAQKTADDTVAEARKTAEDMLAKARKRADALDRAPRDPDRLRAEIRILALVERALHERVRTFVTVADRLLRDATDDVADDLETRDDVVTTPERAAAGQ
jgi:cell division septum initiation protein DivIVA